MTDEETRAEQRDVGEGEPQDAATSAESWKEVAAQLQSLGDALASALKTAWTSEENKRHLKEMRSGIEAMVEELNAAIKDTAASAQAQQLKSEAERTLATVRSAGEKTVQDVRPKLVSALTSANEELRKALARMKSEESSPGSNQS